LNKADIVEAARSAGIGASDGLPAEIKLESKADIVIANGCELEPLVFSSRHVLLHNAAEIINGLELAMQATQAARGIVAYVKRIPEIDAAVQAAACGHAGIEIFHAPPFYPIEDDFTIACAATGRVVPNSATLAAIGVCVLDVETLYNLSRAAGGNPANERTVSITGEVAQPAVLRLPLGTTVGEAIERCGGAKNDDFRVLLGGPISGRIADDLSQPISRCTAAIVVLPANHVQIQRRMRPLSVMLLHARTACTACEECTRYCTRYLSGQDIEPHQIMRVISYSLDSLNKSITSAVNCHECGVCDIVCRMGLSPRVICREIKAHLRAMGWSTPASDIDGQLRTGFMKNRVPLEELAERLGVQKYVQAIDPQQILNAGVAPLRTVDGVMIHPLQTGEEAPAQERRKEE